MKQDIKVEYGLPNRLRGKSFADASKSIERLFKDRMSAPDKRTKQELLSRLKDVQEFQRTQMQQQQGALNQMMFGGPEGEEPEDNSALYQDTFMAKYANQQLGVKQQLPNNTDKVNIFGNMNSWLNKNEGKNSNMLLGGLGIAASVLGPMLANRAAMKSMHKPETMQAYTVDPNQYQANLVNRQQIERNLTNQLSTNRNALQKSSSGDFGQYASNLQALNAGTSNALGNAMLQANMADSQELGRVQEQRGRVGMYNSQQRAQTDDLNQQNLANYYGQIAAYKQATGANIGAIGQSMFNLLQSKQVAKEYMKRAKLQ